MNAIIFGASGQDGIYLTRLLENRNIEVVSITRADMNCQLKSLEDITKLIKAHKPSYIFHLAANSTTRHEAWKENHDTISTGSLNILEAVKLYSPDTKVFLSGSGLQFKNEGKPIKETDDFNASSSYAVSRIHSVYAARYYRDLGINAYVGYLFNHDSPYRTERHINKKISEAAKRIANGSVETLEIGDLKVKKEFGFAGDIIKGMIELLDQDAIFEAVIGTGVAYSIEQWLEACFSQFGLQWEQYAILSEGFTSEYQVLVSDPSTIFSLGWKPETDMNSLAKMMCEA